MCSALSRTISSATSTSDYSKEVRFQLVTRRRSYFFPSLSTVKLARLIVAAISVRVLALSFSNSILAWPFWLLCPVKHRSARAQADLTVIRRELDWCERGPRW
jgi:hypothetical protein